VQIACQFQAFERKELAAVCAKTPWLRTTNSGAPQPFRLPLASQPFTIVKGPKSVNSAGMPPPAAEPGVSIYSSIQQLGLKLDAQRVPMDSIVIDQAEKIPTGN
jgi:uncharacterized protein (TIGR03435 family)